MMYFASTEQSSSLSAVATCDTVAGKDRPYIILCGLGKSGTKRILKLLDLHPNTFCRCEPNELESNPFASLVSREYGDEADAVSLEQGWDKAIAQAARQLGERDYLPTVAKSYHTALTGRWPVYRLMKHATVRGVLSWVVKDWRAAQWSVPLWYARRDALVEALPVFKVGPCPAWVEWLAGHRQQAMVVHVVRHPAGFVNSYRGRFLAGRDVERITLDNQNRLHQIVERLPRWGDVFCDIERMDAVESELWYWRYCNEKMYMAGEGCRHYQLIKDEDVVQDPMRIVEQLFAAVGLEVAGDIKAYIEENVKHWQEATGRWDTLVGDEDQRLIRRVLEGSLMANWWTEDQLVSDYRYNAYGHSRRY